MSAAHFLKTRLSAETKRRVQAAAQRQLLTESVWLRRLVDAALSSDSAGRSIGTEATEGKSFADGRSAGPGSGARLYIRLRLEDRMLLGERAAARGMAKATYIAVLVRAHLRSLTPLPKEEVVALKRSVAELGAIGRNINQIAHAANQGNRIVGPAKEDLRAILKVCEALRDHVKGLIKANVNSWTVGHVEYKS